MLDDGAFLLLRSARGGVGRRFRAWHGRTRAGHERERDRYRARGFRFVSISLHGTAGAPRYSAVMVDRALFIAAEHPVEQRDFPLLTAARFQQTFDEQAAEGFGPVLIAATGTASNPRFCAVFEPMSPIPLTRYGLTSGAGDDESTIQGMNARARAEGLIVRWAASYGSAGDERFAAIWVPNPRRTVWNADGVLETAAEYETRFGVQTSGWCRPAFVTHNGSQRHLSVFVHDDVGPWVARHAMTSAGYQSALDAQVRRGYVPTCVQGSGAGAATRYSALFAKRLEPVPDQFTASGPVANAEIDGLIYQTMRDSPVWNASLAIVRGTELVYARAYSWGEPDWPLVMPTTRFRVASVSKTMGALGIYQLIESCGLTLDTAVQDVLQLTTPSGDPPADARFGLITVRHLLEHTSGLPTGAQWQEIQIRNAFRAALPDQPWTLPVTPEMTDAYIAAQDLGPDPGTTAQYSNCGYYLLGRVLARVRGRATAFAALQEFLFDPLDMTRSRPAPTDLATMPDDEARYRAQDLKVAASRIHEDRRLVPAGYGANLAKGGCAGGYSMAAVDLGRIAAIMISDEDTPALTRTTVEQMMNNGIATQQAFRGRAGHGWDAVATRPSDRFYAQKGGSLETSGNVLQFDGEWGYALCWGGRATAAGAVLGGYPDNATMMDIARAASWTRDLFPEFGMAPLP